MTRVNGAASPPQADAPERLSIKTDLADFGRTLLPYLRPHARGAIAAGLSALPQVLFISTYPVLLGTLIDRGIVARDAGLSVLIISVLVALLALTAVGDLLTQYLCARIAATLVSDVRLHLFDHLQRLSMGYFSRARVGDLMARLTVSLEAIERVLAVEAPLLATQLLIMVLGGALLVTLNLGLAVLSLLLLPLLAVGPRWLGPRAAQASYTQQAETAQLIATLQENLSAQQLVKTFGLHDLFRERVRHESSRLARSSFTAAFMGGTVGASMNAGGYIMLVVVIGAGTYLTFQDSLSLGALVAFFELLWWIVGAVQQLAVLADPIQRATAAARRIQELLSEQPDVIDPPHAAPVPRLEQEISFDGVHFSYDGTAPQLVDLSFSVPRGANVAFVGPSGSGKSTVLQLLMRLYDPAQGRIMLDGRDIRNHKQILLRARMSAVLQDNVLFNMSIRENIRLGNPQATDSQVEGAARDAEVDEVIRRLPLGYDTPVGERGSRLSGGERQRIAIARALLRDPDLLILDEASSALDAATEAALNATLARVGQGRTVVSVTHRLRNTTDADQIFVMRAGRLVEQGTHAELLARNGTYHELWTKQHSFTLTQGDRGVPMAHIEPQALRTIPILADLPDELLLPLADLLVPVSLPRGRTVVSEGDPADTFYLLARGRVAVTHEEPVREVVNVLEDGDYFGEVALLSEGVRTATVTTLTECQMLMLGRDPFLRLLQQVPQVDREVRERASLRWR